MAQANHKASKYKDICNINFLYFALCSTLKAPIEH